MSHDKDGKPDRPGPPALLILGFGLFLVVIGYLVVASLVRPKAVTFMPRPPHAGGLAARPGVDTTTIDTTDPERWRYVDLDRGRLLSPPDTSGWDLALRRYHIVSAGANADAGPLAFDEVNPSAGSVALPAGGDTTRHPLGRWYRYSMFSHLLEPNGHLYLIRTDEGRVVKLEVLSYYCPGLTAGCLTFRYGSAGT